MAFWNNTTWIFYYVLRGQARCSFCYFNFLLYFCLKAFKMRLKGVWVLFRYSREDQGKLLCLNQENFLKQCVNIELKAVLGFLKYNIIHIKTFLRDIWDFPGGSDGKASAYNAGDPGFNPQVGKISWRRKWQPTPVFLPGKSHGRRNLVGYSPCGHKESVTTERLHFHFQGIYTYAVEI